MNLKPLPGYMIVKLESLYKDTGLIEIPERFKAARHVIATIVEFSMRSIDRRALGTELKIGNRIITTLSGGRHLSEDMWMYPITLIRRDINNRKYRDSGIEAIVSDTVDLSAHSQEIERCQFCGDAQSGIHQNMIMVDGVCPRCGKDKYGKIPDKSLKVSDEERERFKQSQRRIS